MEPTTNNISSRKGNIVINRELLQQYVTRYDFNNPIFKEFVPVDVKYDYMSDTIRIVGYSPHFRPLYDETIPDYNVVVNRRVVQEDLFETTFVEIRR